MALTVKLYQFSKRENSTKVPANTDTSIDVSVLLKSGTDVVDPVLILDDAITSYTSYNYAYIADFSRYYFIQKMEHLTGNRVNLYLTCDVLASYAADIKAISNAFIEYSSMPTNIVTDPRIPALTVPISNASNNSLHDTIFTENGCVIISSCGNKNSGLFILSDTDDIYDIFDGIDWDTIPSGDDTATTLKKGFEQFFTKEAAPRNLRSAFALPWVIHGDAIGTQVSDLTIGSFPTGKTVYRVKNDIILDSCEISINWIYSDWRRCSKYTTLIIYLPLFGLVNLPVDSLSTDSSIRVTYAFSYANGDVSYQIQGVQSSHIVAVGYTNASAPVAVGNSNINNTKLATSAASGAVGFGTLAAGALGAATLGVTLPAAAMIGAGAALGGGILGAIDALNGQAPLGGGGFGGFTSSALDPVIHLYVLSTSLTCDPVNMAALFGYPRFSNGSLSGLTGFCKLRDFTFNKGISSERQKVSDYLNSGFYLE